MFERDSFLGSVAVVTGGSRGIGAGIAFALAERGARVVVTGRDRAALDGVVHSIHEAGGTALAVTTDLTDEADAVTIANDTPFGLSGSIWTSDVGRAIRVARAVESGNLSVNSHSSVRYWTPFGGFKQSGLGRELGPDAPNAFTETKNVCVAVKP